MNRKRRKKIYINAKNETRFRGHKIKKEDTITTLEWTKTAKQMWQEGYVIGFRR